MINTNFENGILTVTIEGSLDTSNYEEVQNKLISQINKNNAQNIIIDLKNLNYISSAGLRVLFKIKQLINNTKIINASLAVYEIFDISGLTQLMDVNKSLTEIDMSSAEEQEKGNTGVIYKLKDGSQVKVYNEDYDIEDVQEEILLGQSALAFGASNSISFDIQKAGDRFAVKFSDMPFESFTDAINKHPENFDEYMDKFYDAFVHMSSVECPEDELSTVNEILNARLDTLDKILNEDQKSALKKLINSLKDGYDMVHGDITPTNFNLLDGELVLINNAKLMEGPAIYDVYCLQRYFCESTDFEKKQIQHLIGLDGAIIKKIKNAFYNRYLSELDNNAKIEKIEKIDLASTLEKFLYLGTKTPERIEQLGEIYKAKYLDSILMPKCDEICELLKTL